MDRETVKVPWRGVLFIIGLATQLRQQLVNCLEVNFAFSCLSRNKYLSIQTNYFIIIWLGLFLLWRHDDKKLANLTGKLRGAITVYITITWLAYWVLLSSQDSPTGWDAITNIIIHYAYPIAFIADWVVYERDRYEWNYYKTWAFYPIGYAIFAIINGVLGLELGFIYTFLEPENNNWGGPIMMISGIFLLFTVLSMLYIFVNREYLTLEK